MNDRKHFPGEFPPRVVIHNSLARNLQHRASPFHSVISSSGHSPNHAQRPLSGAQTPREMVWVDSKERLSEMATNIRGISHALANVALTIAVKNILIVSKLSDDEIFDNAHEMVDWLLGWTPSNSEKSSQIELVLDKRDNKSQKLVLYIEDILIDNSKFGFEKIRNKYSDRRIRRWNTESIGLDAEKIDLVVTLGGDGTVLYTSWLFQKMVPPTISFGLGSLGFMTENNFHDYAQILNGHLIDGICCSLRMRFECTVMRTTNSDKTSREDLENEIREAGKSYGFKSHTKDIEYTILNEVVVDRGPNPFVTMTELYGNFELLTSIKADGVVISTPTGSTAYSMSAGGSLVHPDIPARLISPICPHTLSFRPLVVPDSMVLHIGVPYDARSSAFVSFDGKARVELRRGDFLAINASPYPFPKVLQTQSTSVSWVQQLSRTLNWNEQKRPKRYTNGDSDNWGAER